MHRLLIGLLLAAPFMIAPAVQAQEGHGAGRVEIGAFPVGGIFFTNSSSASEPDFGNFALGATVTYRINRWIGVEGEVGDAIGVNQQMRFGNVTVAERQSPCLVAYSGNLVVNSTGARSALVPYLTAGIGGMTLYGGDDVAALGILGSTTYRTANVGGGSKWYMRRHWGLRADYRLVIVDNKAGAPAFFGRDTVRYGHRVYGGLLFTY